MQYLLFIPGLLFLLVIFFRVILPLIKEPRWKRLLDSARYHRHKEQAHRSDMLLEKAVLSAPDRPETYLEYYLNHSEQGNLQRRFSILFEGYERIGDVPLTFMVGSAYLEEGDLKKALEILEKPEIREYMASKRVFLLVHLFLELERPDDAEKAYFEALNRKGEGLKEFLDNQTALDLCPYLFILEKRGEDYQSEMERIPRTSVRSEMGWEDLLQYFIELKEHFEPAVTGIHGSPDRFNRRRTAFFEKHLALIDSFIKD